MQLLSFFLRQYIRKLRSEIRNITIYDTRTSINKEISACRWLLKLRDMIVKPFGLKTGISFDDKIKEQNTNEIILGAEDKHLSFYISLFCSEINSGKQTVSVSTIVKYNNFSGRIYFSAIWIFHKILVSYTFRRAIKIQRRQKQ